MLENSIKTEVFYNTISAEYARTYCHEHDNKPKDIEMLNRFSKEIGTESPVWEFGCGPGYTTAYLKKSGVEISGMDLSEGMVGQARTIHPHIHFQKGDMMNLEFKDNSVAGIVSFYAMLHFSEEELKCALHEISRVLKPDGIFFFTFHVGEKKGFMHEIFGKRVDITYRFFTLDFMLECLKESGFNQIEIMEREPYKDIENEGRRAYVFAKAPVQYMLK